MSNINVIGQQAYFNEDAKFFKDVYIYGTLYYQFESKTKEIFSDIEVNGIATFNGPVVFNDSVEIGDILIVKDLTVTDRFNVLGNSVFSGISTFNDNVGIGTTNPTSKLQVVGDVLVSGIVTATTFFGNLIGYATNAGIATNVIGGIGSITQLQVTGISTFTNGPVLMGAGTSTGTASQRLQVTGGAYVSGSTGIGTTNPSSALDVNGTITASNTPFFRTGPTISADYTIGPSYNEMSVGPITINNGVTVTVSLGGNWVII